MSLLRCRLLIASTPSADDFMRQNERNYVIGVDLDNTIVSYDHLLHRIALERNLIAHDVLKNKKVVRDHIRHLPDGEVQWQKLQAVIYGPRMGEAQLVAGVTTFFGFCRENGIPVYVVSHKTEYANYDETDTNLRQAALDWMLANRFFETEGLGITEDNVYFESTRREKVARIRRLKCTHFIDDLEETFLEDEFPPNIQKILFAPHLQHPASSEIIVAISWREISDHIFKTSP